MKTKIEIGRGDVVKYKLKGQKVTFGFVLCTLEFGEIRTETDGVICESDVIKVYKDKNGFGRDLADLYHKRDTSSYDIAITLLKTMQFYKDLLTAKVRK